MSLRQREVSRIRAQAIVEFALVMPLFLLLLFALIDFGRLEFSYVSLANAAREMARSAAISPSCTPVFPATSCTPSSAEVTTSSLAVGQSFKNYEGFILNDLHSSPNNTVTVTVTDRSGVVSQSTPAACSLPLDPTLCALPTRFGLSGGYVDVVATFQFTFNPLFQNRLTGILDASFMQQFATLSTTARAYIE